MKKSIRWADNRALFTAVTNAIVTDDLARKPENIESKCDLVMTALGLLIEINVAEVHQGQLLALTIKWEFEDSKMN